MAHVAHEAELLKSLAADAVEDGVYAAKRAIKSVKRGVEHLGDRKDETAYRVRRQPLKAIGIAAGAGLVLGMAVGWIGGRFGKRKPPCTSGDKAGGRLIGASSVQILRSMGPLSFAVIVSLSSACSDRSVPASASPRQPAASLLASDPAAVQAPAAEVAAAIEAQIDGRDPALGALTPGERAELNALYQPGGYSPLWFDAAGRTDHDARDAMALINGAADEGLDPADYYQSEFDRLAAARDAGPPWLPRDLARVDAALSAGTLRYLRHLHTGRVDPRTIGFRLSVPADHHDFGALLRSALGDHRIIETAASLRLPLAQYGALRAMLARYRSLAADETLESLPPSSTVVRPGEPYQEIGILYRQLVAFGDLPADTATPPDPARYEGMLEEGVKRFQVRHGLEPDGSIGKRTLAALRIPLTWRVRQIELALERLRWLPDLGDERLVVINIPMFRLWAWGSSPSTVAPSFGMDVIVGRALSTQTPVFVEEMREVIFRPYWNVPRSILRHEILPILERDPDYLQRQDMEIVSGPGDDAQQVPVTAENIADLQRGVLRVRQRPGPRNSLGLIKFVFPNEENVYMHGTPAPELFSRSRRDFSHGCVRVQDPVALAEWVLKDRPEWNRDRILVSMAGSQSLHVKLTRPVQVILFYTTAAVMPEDGTIRFVEDIYGHDARLNRALASRQSAQ